MKPATNPVSKLKPKQAVFAREYLVDLNATQAAIRAGYSARSAERIAIELLRKTEVQEAIADSRQARAARTDITADKVLSRFWDIATADPNEIVSHRVGACRYCHGVGNAFQWANKAEYGQAVSEALAQGLPVPTQEGGFGHDATAEPNADCPVCRGEGVGRVVVAETRKLKGPARKLYAGVKKTRNGIEIQLHDQMKALENVARHLGMFNYKLTLRGDAENPLLVLIQQVQGSAFKPVGAMPRGALSPPVSSAISPVAKPRGGAR